jgi:PAS domain S-box-containing protein
MDASVNEILLFDAQEFRFVQSNTAARNNLGYNLRELSELTPFEVFDGIPRGELETLFRDLREPRRHDAMFEAANVRRDGSSYPVEVRLQYFDNERPPLFLATLMDLSERRQREDQMRRAQKMEAVGQLAGGLAHDFNNLLTVISGNLEMSQLAQNAQADLDRAEMIEEAVAAARRGAELTQRLLAFARQQPLEPTAVDAGALVANMTELLRRTLGVVIRVETMIDDGLPPVLSDAAQLENALLNLALNARDAMPDGGLLRVEVDATEQGPEAEAEGDPSPRARCVQVRVTDTGVGIGAEVLSQVFEPFFTTKRAQHGTGLGLSMVYGFVRQSGGRIGIRSQPGAGTTVTMSFPVAEGIEPAVAARAKEGAEPVCGSECILVVEDDDSVRRLAALTLSSLGYRVIQASNGDEALEALGDGRSVDLLFTDLHIPGNTGGSELVRVLRERRIVLPVLVTSGFSAGHDDEPIADVGFLPKPHSTGALARRVRAALDAHD